MSHNVSSSTTVPLYIDPQIRDWVLFPITLVMILVGVLRHYIMILLQSQPKKQSLEVIREQRALFRSQILRATSAYSPAPPLYYRTISQHLIDGLRSGTYLKDGPPKSNSRPTMPNPMDPSTMDGMLAGMKTQLVMMVPQMIIMGWINFFFQGFVLIKLPFPLTLGFKSMLQRGIDTVDMDVRWVSSLSWYFLNFFGLNGLYYLTLNGDQYPSPNINSALITPSASGTPQDFIKIFKSERENLEFSEGMYSWVGTFVEDRVLRKYGKLEGKLFIR